MTATSSKKKSSKTKTSSRGPGAAEAQLKAFQSNLLSLISHELRTPLTGVLNPITALRDAFASGATADLPTPEFLEMAIRNANQLKDSLSKLFDLGALDTGIFHLKLQEVDWLRLIRSRVDRVRAHYAERGFEWKDTGLDARDRVVLSDPQKLIRAVDLLLTLPLGTTLQNSGGEPVRALLRAKGNEIELQFELGADGVKAWAGAAEHARRLETDASRGRVLAQVAQTLQSEDDFLSRSVEGLGVEFYLVHEILARHKGYWSWKSDLQGKRGKFTLKFGLPELSTREALREVLLSRIFKLSTDVGSVALAIVHIPTPFQDPEEFRARLRTSLFRASDAVYRMDGHGLIAIVMDDCRREDAPKLLARMGRAIGHELKAGIVSCPEEGTDPDLLIRLAEARLK